MKTSSYKSTVWGQTNGLLPTSKSIVYDSFHFKIAAKNNKISQKRTQNTNKHDILYWRSSFWKAKNLTKFVFQEKLNRTKKPLTGQNLF